MEKVTIKGATKIPDAEAAPDKELQNLENLPAWDLNKVTANAQAIKNVEKDERNVHFASLMGLRHPNKRRAPQTLQKYKGRAVQSGDNVKDDEGCQEFFTKRGASASQMAVATFFDTIARLPGMSGQANDAVSAYTQVCTPPSQLFQKKNVLRNRFVFHPIEDQDPGTALRSQFWSKDISDVHLPTTGHWITP